MGSAPEICCPACLGKCRSDNRRDLGGDKAHGRRLQYRVCCDPTCGHRFKVHVEWERVGNMLTIVWTILDDDAPDSA